MGIKTLTFVKYFETPGQKPPHGHSWVGYFWSLETRFPGACGPAFESRCMIVHLIDPRRSRHPTVPRGSLGQSACPPLDCATRRQPPTALPWKAHPAYPGGPDSGVEDAALPVQLALPPPLQRSRLGQVPLQAQLAHGARRGRGPTQAEPRRSPGALIPHPGAEHRPAPGGPAPGRRRAMSTEQVAMGTSPPPPRFPRSHPSPPWLFLPGPAPLRNLTRQAVLSRGN